MKLGFLGFVFGQESGNEKSFGSAIGKLKAELKLSHQFGEVVVTICGIALWVKDAAEIAVSEDAFCFGFQNFVTEKGVDALRYPVRIENASGLENGMLAEVED